MPVGKLPDKRNVSIHCGDMSPQCIPTKCKGARAPKHNVEAHWRSTLTKSPRKSGSMRSVSVPACPGCRLTCTGSTSNGAAVFSWALRSSLDVFATVTVCSIGATECAAGSWKYSKWRSRELNSSAGFAMDAVASKSNTTFSGFACST